MEKEIIMRNLIFLVIFFVLLCKSYSITTTDSLKQFSLQILENPEKILNIPLFFPKYYSNNYNSEFFKDTTYLQNLCKFIKRNFPNKKIKFNFRETFLSDYELIPLKEGINLYNFDSTNFNSFVIVYGEYGIMFSFVHLNNEYYLINVAPFPELIHQINEQFKTILKQPEQLLNIEEYYSEFVNLNYLDKRMLDTVRISKMIELINECKICKSDEPIITYDHNYLDNLFLNTISSSEIGYSYFIDNLIINFQFVKNNKNIYLKFISIRKY